MLWWILLSRGFHILIDGFAPKCRCWCVIWGICEAFLWCFTFTADYLIHHVGFCAYSWIIVLGTVHKFASVDFIWGKIARQNLSHRRAGMHHFCIQYLPAASIKEHIKIESTVHKYPLEYHTETSNYPSDHPHRMLFICE